MTKRLLASYEAVLNLAGLSATSDGCVSTTAGNLPFVIAGKRLVLPTTDHLRDPSPKTIVFHPLRENVMRGESVVFREYRRTLAVRLNLALFDMIADLLVLAMTPDKHKNLSPRQSEVLSLLKDAGKVTLEVANKIQAAVMAEDEKTRGGTVLKSNVKLFVKPSGKKNDRAFTRLGVVSFPIYADLKAGKDPFGVSMAKKHRDILIAVWEYLFPNIEEENFYGYGSNSTVAPAFEAMFRSFLNIYQRLAETVTAFEGSGVFENAMKVNLLEFTNVANLNFEELDRDAQTVPMQAGNEGSVAVEDTHSDLEGDTVNTVPVTENGTVKKSDLSPAEIRARQEERTARELANRREAPENRRSTPVLPSDYREREPVPAASNTVKFKDLAQGSRRDAPYTSEQRFESRDRRDRGRGEDRERAFRDLAYGRDKESSLNPYADLRRDNSPFDPRAERFSSDRGRDDRSRGRGPGF
jgi:hypothetical protein